MKFSVYMDGSVQMDVEAIDAEDAANTAAKGDFDSSAGETPRDNAYDVTVMDPDGEITRYDVVLEYEPTFTAWKHKESPSDEAVAALRADRRATEGGAS